MPVASRGSSQHGSQVMFFQGAPYSLASMSAPVAFGGLTEGVWSLMQTLIGEE